MAAGAGGVGWEVCGGGHDMMAGAALPQQQALLCTCSHR